MCCLSRTRNSNGVGNLTLALSEKSRLSVFSVAPWFMILGKLNHKDTKTQIHRALPREPDKCRA